MKNLANCSGVEFLVQTNKIRHAVADWVGDIGLAEVRKHKPVLVVITDNMTTEEKKEAEAENQKRINAQIKKNLSDMLDIALEKEAEKTLKVLALMCFMDENTQIDNILATELLSNFAEIIGNEAVLGFFSSLVKSGLMNTLITLKT